MANYYVQHYITNKSKGSHKKQLSSGNNYLYTKTIKCDLDLQTFIRNVFAQRQKFSQQSPFTSKILLETKISRNSQQNRQLAISTPYVNQTSIMQNISTSLQITGNPKTEEEKATGVSDVVNKLILVLLKSSNHQLYTFESLMFENMENASNLRITINKTSIVGMQLILQNKQISKQDFIEIYELLGSKIFQKSEECRLTIQQKFRAIGVMILSMIFEKRINVFDQQRWNSHKKLNHMEKYKQFLAESPKRFYELLNNSQVVKQIKKVQTMLKVNYLQFLNEVFVNEKELLWSQALELLCQKWRPQTPALNKYPIGVIQMAKLIKQNQIKSDSRQQVRLKELGLLEQSQLKIYFISLLSQELLSAKILLGYQNLNEFIYNQNRLNLKERDIIFHKLIKILSSLGIQYKLTQSFIKTQSCFEQLQFNHRDRFSINADYNQNCTMPKNNNLIQQIQKEKNKQTPNQNKSRSQSINNCQLIIDLPQTPQQGNLVDQYSNLVVKNILLTSSQISSNFGTLKTQNRKLFMSRTHEKSTICKYRRFLSD